MKIKKLLPLIFLLGIISIMGCGPSTQNTQTTSQQTTQNVEVASEWKEVELKDVTTGETFKVSDFQGKPVLLESFAVWCPTCTRQQKEIQTLHNQVGDSIISISLDTDPNEDKAKVQEHVQRNNFKGLYAIAPPDMTRSLIDQFGVSIANAPSAPVVLICPDGTARLLRSGVKTPDELQQEVATCN